MFRPIEIQAAAPAIVVDISTAYASGDLLFDSIKLQNAALNGKGFAYLRQLLVTDLANQKTAFDLIFFNADPGTLGTLNVAVNITAAQLATAIAYLSVASADYTTLKANTNAIACKNPTNLTLPCLAVVKDVWVAGISRGTPTYATAADLQMKFMLERY